MCVSPATMPTARKPYAPTRDGCTWLDADAADRLRSGEPAMIRICVMRLHKVRRHGREVHVRRPHVEIYMAGWDARRKKWTLTRDDEGSGSGAGFKTYRLSRDLWTCDCDSANYGKEPCKHVKALARALPAVGIDPVAGPKGGA